MSGYIGRRLLSTVVMLLLLTLVVFLLFSVLPSDPARLTCGKACSPAVVEANRHRLGLDLPVWEQYWVYLKGIFAGRTYGSGTATFPCDAPCLGYSFKRGQDVTSLLIAAFPPTFWLAIGSFVLWMAAGISGGVYSALRRGRWQDKGLLTVTLVGYSLPAFFIGLIAIYFIVIRWELLPFPHYVSPFEDPVMFAQTMLLPWTVLAVSSAAYYVRLTRNQMLDTLGEDYIRTARAKGVIERVVIRNHALRAGLTPIVTSAGLDFAGLLGGVITIEFVFGIPGLGSLAANSVADADLSLLVGITLVTAAFVIVANLVVDVLYAVIDPRVRLV